MHKFFEVFAQSRAELRHGERRRRTRAKLCGAFNQEVSEIGEQAMQTGFARRRGQTPQPERGVRDLADGIVQPGARV